MPTVYLIHIDPPFRHKKHYIGATERDPIVRLREHDAGTGAQLTKQAVAAGATLALARVWENVPWEFERKLKGRGAAPLCPVCNPLLLEGTDLSAEGG